MKKKYCRKIIPLINCTFCALIEKLELLLKCVSTMPKRPVT